eukprot:Lankesteria_metandrocarpae@DN3004_c0_g1_i1.p1
MRTGGINNAHTGGGIQPQRQQVSSQKDGGGCDIEINNGTSSRSPLGLSNNAVPFVSFRRGASADDLALESGTGTVLRMQHNMMVGSRRMKANNGSSNNIQSLHNNSSSSHCGAVGSSGAMQVVGKLNSHSSTPPSDQHHTHKLQQRHFNNGHQNYAPVNDQQTQMDCRSPITPAIGTLSARTLGQQSVSPVHRSSAGVYNDYNDNTYSPAGAGTHASGHMDSRQQKMPRRHNTEQPAGNIDNSGMRHTHQLHHAHPRFCESNDISAGMNTGTYNRGIANNTSIAAGCPYDNSAVQGGDFGPMGGNSTGVPMNTVPAGCMHTGMSNGLDLNSRGVRSGMNTGSGSTLPLLSSSSVMGSSTYDVLSGEEDDDRCCRPVLSPTVMVHPAYANLMNSQGRSSDAAALDAELEEAFNAESSFLNQIDILNHSGGMHDDGMHPGVTTMAYHYDATDTVSLDADTGVGEECSGFGTGDTVHRQGDGMVGVPNAVVPISGA